MRRFLFAVILTAFSLGATAQSIVRDGNTYKQVTTTQNTHKKDTLVTRFSFEDAKGNKYPIIISKRTGACYVWRKSNKTGKMYKSYMKTEISNEIAQTYGIERRK